MLDQFLKGDFFQRMNIPVKHFGVYLPFADDSLVSLDCESSLILKKSKGVLEARFILGEIYSDQSERTFEAYFSAVRNFVGKGEGIVINSATDYAPGESVSLYSGDYGQPHTWMFSCSLPKG